MKRTSLLPLLVALVLGGVTAGVKLVYDVVPNPMAENNRNEPLFLRDRSEWKIAVTLVDNPDTGFSPGRHGGQHHWALPEERRNQAKIRIWSIAAEHRPVSVRFTCDYASSQPGITDYAVGTSLELGAWDTRHAVALAHRPAQNQWNGSIDVPADQDILWKCIERNNNASDAVLWQPGPNVSFTNGTESETRGTF
ncbi:MAG: carbohydrate-binding module family 20 domain-containing protein [Pseudomonas mandelii]